LQSKPGFQVPIGTGSPEIKMSQCYLSLSERITSGDV